jgi:hypothetical protein
MITLQFVDLFQVKDERDRMMKDYIATASLLP